MSFFKNYLPSFIRNRIWADDEVMILKEEEEENKNLRDAATDIEAPKISKNNERKEEKEEEKTNIFKTLKSHAILMWKLKPYLWPANRWDLKIRVIISLLFLLVSKIANVLAPFAYKIAVDSLSQGASSVPWEPVVWYALGRFSAGFFGDLRDSIFVKVTNHALQQAAVETFTHLHHLSISYHLQRKTGTVLMGIDRGTRGISFLTSFMLFNILPIILEVTLVCIVMLVKYVPWMSFITLAIIVSYILFTLFVTEWRTKFRREMNEEENKAKDKAVDSLLNFETVKYFSAEKHEIKRYQSSLQKYAKAAEKSQFSLAFLNIGQSGIIGLGQFIVMLVAAFEVFGGRMTVGDFVLVNTYILQVYAPLNFLGTSYRMIKQSLVDIESMLDILDQENEVNDIPNANPMNAEMGEVVFKDVYFHYKGKDDVLKGINFTVRPGKQLAIVGGSGSGKTTITKLLYRLYEPQRGKILIDGIDISQVKQEELRKSIGIVPQDTVLFNDTILYNIRYGNLKATQSEVEKAADVARIMNFIEQLPDKWETRVGERGLKLSGGEKQRVSIARAVLKQPVVLICDEATSSLDSSTEREIQDSLRDVFKNKTTTIVLAHRLSTIMDSDEIIVLKDGVISERGTHEELISLGGLYKLLWDKQSKSNLQPRPEEIISPTENLDDETIVLASSDNILMTSKDDEMKESEVIIDQEPPPTFGQSSSSSSSGNQENSRNN